MPCDLTHVLSFLTDTGAERGRQAAEALAAAAGYPDGGIAALVDDLEYVRISPVVYVSQNVVFATFFRALGLSEDRVEGDVDRLFKKHGAAVIAKTLNALMVVVMSLHERPREFNINLEGEVEAYATEYFEGRVVSEFKCGDVMHVGVHPKFVRSRVFTTFKNFRETLARGMDPDADLIDAARAFLQSEPTWVAVRPRTLGVFKTWSRRDFFVALDLGFPTGADVQAALVEMNPDFRGERVLLTEGFRRGAFNIGNYEKMVTVRTACRGLYGALPKDVLAYITDFIPIEQWHGSSGICKDAYQRFDKLLMTRHKVFLEVFFFFMWFRGGLPDAGDGECWDLYAHMLEEPERALDWTWTTKLNVTPKWVKSQFESVGPGRGRLFTESDTVMSVTTKTAPGVGHGLFLPSFADKSLDDWKEAGYEFAPGKLGGPLVRGSPNCIALREMTIDDVPGLGVSMPDTENGLDFNMLDPDLVAFTFFMEEFLARRHQANDRVGEHPAAIRGFYRAYKKGNLHPVFNEIVELTPVARLSCSGCGHDLWSSHDLGRCGQCGFHLPPRVVDLRLDPDGKILQSWPRSRVSDVELRERSIMVFPWDRRYMTAMFADTEVGYAYRSNSVLVAPNDDPRGRSALQLPFDGDLFRRIFADLNLSAYDYLNGDRLFGTEDFQTISNLMITRANYGAPFQWVSTYGSTVMHQVVDQTEVIYPPDEDDGPVPLSLLGWDSGRLAAGGCPAWFSNQFSPDRWRLNYLNLLYPVLSPRWCEIIERMNQVPRLHGPGGTKLYDMKHEADLVVEEAMRDLMVIHIPAGWLLGVRDQIHVVHPGPRTFDVYNVDLDQGTVPGMWLRRMQRTLPELHTIMVYDTLSTTGQGIHMFPVVPLLDMWSDHRAIGDRLVFNNNNGAQHLLHIYTTSPDVFTELRRVQGKSVARLSGSAPGETMDPFVDLRSVFRVLHYHGQPLHVYLGGRVPGPPGWRYAPALWRVDKDEAAKDNVRCTIPPRSLVMSAQTSDHAVRAVSMHANRTFSRYMKLVCS